MSIILKIRLIIFVFFSIIFLEINAQFLDKTYYLVDSIESATISKNDRSFLDEKIKSYRVSKTDTAKVQIISALIEGLQDEKIWLKYNRLLNNYSLSKEKTISDTTSRTYYVYKCSEALALNNFGYYYFNYSNKFDLALKYYLQGLKINEDYKNYNDLITSYSNVGNTYQNQGDLNTALIYYQKSLALENKISNKQLLLAPLNNIAQVYFHLYDTLKAIETLKKAFKISSTSDNKFIKGSLLHNIGSLSYFNGDKTGIQTLQKALAFRKEIGDKKGTLQTTLSLAGIEAARKNYLISEKYFEEAKKLIVYFKNSSIEALYYYQLSNYNELTGKKELAIDNLEKSVSIYKKNAENDDMVNALTNLINLYGSNNAKYALRKIETYELRQHILKNIDKTSAQRLLLKQKYEEDLKINEAKFILEQQLKDEKNKAEKQKQQLILIAVCIILIAALIFSVFIYKALKANKQKNRIISDQKIEVEHQKHLIEEKHKDITDSITYAHRIQSSLIPNQHQLNNLYSGISIIFKPKDIVSGDFYWFNKVKEYNIFVLADCTGHGVPGAFMSIIGINCLNTLVLEKGITTPHLILNELKKGVVNSLNSDKNSADKKDGMDVALVTFTNEELVFSGANQSVMILRNNELIILKGNKQPVGFFDTDETFTSVTFKLLTCDRIILFSDGIVDQFGGLEGKKLKIVTFRKWILETSDLTAKLQLKEIEDRLNAYMKSFEQTDDITLAIIEINN